MTLRTTRLLSPTLALATALTLTACGGGSGATASKSSGEASTATIADKVKVLETAVINEDQSSLDMKSAQLLARLDTTGVPKMGSVMVTFSAKLKNGKTKTNVTSMPVYRSSEPLWAAGGVIGDAEVVSVSATAQYMGPSHDAPDAELKFGDFQVSDMGRVTFAVTNPGTKMLRLASGPIICFDAKKKPVAAGLGMAEKVAPKSTSKAGYALMSGDPKGATCQGFTKSSGGSSSSESSSS